MRGKLILLAAAMACQAPTSTGAQVVFVDASYDQALPPVPLDRLRPVLDRDLAGELHHGALAPATHGGVVIGVVQHGQRRIFSYGPVRADGIFEIGSITKTFTGLLLAQAVAEGRLRLDEPVRSFLPATVPRRVGAEITLRDLTTQHSGLPSDPTGIDPAHPDDAFADYGPEDLYAYVTKSQVGTTRRPGYLYSNTGMKLLGQLLTIGTGLSYEALLAQQVLDPLGMHDTRVTPSAAMEQRTVQGYDELHRPTNSPTPRRLPGAAGLWSSAGDMLTYLEAELHPERIAPRGAGKTLAAAIRLSQQVEATADPGMHIAMNWFRSDADDTFQHGGIMWGYTAMAVFNPNRDFGVIVLCNTSGDTHSLAIRLANHVAQRLAGQPALSLDSLTK